ncbi:Gx transporter family protein [Mesoaciditoga sp.]
MSISKKVSIYGMLVAIGSAIYVLENFIPFPLPLPGARWGFSNVVIVYALPFTNIEWLLALVMGKALIGAIISGKIFTPAFFMGISGSTMAALTMFLSYKAFRKAGMIFHSVLGALSNNVVQVLIGAQIVSSWMIFGYLPYMEILGVISGSANGIVAGIMLKRMKVMR